jgi:hypothetical protein
LFQLSQQQGSFSVIIIMAKQKENYGTLAGASEDEEKQIAAATDKSYDADHTYYLRDSGGGITARKLLLIAAPILAAVLIMGGISFVLFHDFNRLYPGRGGDAYSNNRGGGGGGSTTTHTNVATVEGPSPSPGSSSKHLPQSSSATSSTKKSSNTTDTVMSEEDIGRSCSVHPDCSALLGDCCPTGGGVFLACCE